MLLDRLDELDLRVHDLRGDRARLVADLVERIDKCRDQLVSRRAVPALGRGVGALGGLALGAPTARGARWRSRGCYETHDRWLDEEGLEDFGLSIVRALELLRAPPRPAGGRPRGRPPRAGRRVPGHQPRPGRAALPAGRGRGEPRGGGRRRPGHLPLPRSVGRRTSPTSAAGSRTRPELRLEVNHRSTQPILDAAAAVVLPIPDRAPKTHRRAAGGGRAGPPLLAGARSRRAGPRGGARDPAAGRGGGPARGAGGADARGAPGGAARHRGARARRGPPSGARRIRALRAARGARGGRLAARRGRSVRRPGAPAARLRPAPRPALDGGGRRGVGRRGPRGPGDGGARRGRPAGRRRRARRRAGRGRPRRRRAAAGRRADARSSTSPACAGRRSRPGAARARRGSPGWRRWSGWRARSPRPSRPSTPAAWPRGSPASPRSASGASPSRRPSAPGSR